MFKRSAVWFLAVCLAILPACSKQNFSAEDIVFSFACKIDVSGDCGSATCSFVRAGPQNASVGILSGGAEGLNFDWSGGAFSVSYGKLSVEGGSCVLPGTSFASLLVGALDRAQQKEALTRNYGGEFSGRAGGFDFILKADPATGRISELSVPDKKLQVKFYGYGEQKL